MSKQFLALSLFFLSALVRAQDASIDQFVQLGMKNSSRLRAYAALVSQASAGHQLAKTALAPSLNFVGAGTSLDKDQRATVGPMSLTAANRLQGRVGVEANVDLDISRDSHRRIELSDIAFQAAMLRYEKAKNDLVFDIRTAVLQIRQVKELAETAEAAKANAIDRKAVVDQLFDKGVLTRFDVLRAETEVSDATQKLTSARNRITIARANLSRLIEVNEKDLPGIRQDDDLTWTQSPDDTTKLALTSRPDLKEAQMSVLAARLGVRLSAASLRPNATLGLQSYGLSNPGAFEPKGWLSGATLTIRIPILDRGQARAERSTAEAKVSEAESMVKSLEEAIRFEVIEALALHQDALERVSVARKARVQAEEQYRIANQRFKAGLTQGSLSPLLELSDSQTVLTQAKNNLTSAEIDLNLAITKIRYVVSEKTNSEVSK